MLNIIHSLGQAKKSKREKTCYPDFRVETSIILRHRDDVDSASLHTRYRSWRGVAWWAKRVWKRFLLVVMMMTACLGCLAARWLRKESPIDESDCTSNPQRHEIRLLEARWFGAALARASLYRPRPDQDHSCSLAFSRTHAKQANTSAGYHCSHGGPEAYVMLSRALSYKTDQSTCLPYTPHIMGPGMLGIVIGLFEQNLLEIRWNRCLDGWGHVLENMSEPRR